MGDIGEMYSNMKEHSKKKRAGNRENAITILNDNNISFESKNNGAHFIVFGSNEIIDYWPGTGKFISRRGHTECRGVRNLIKLAK